MAKIDDPTYKSTTKLFLSADVINSTKLKYTEERNVWINVFIDFFNDLTLGYSEQLKDKFGKSIQPVVWKSLGDELIFIEHVEEINEIQKYIECFKEAISKLNDEKIKKKSKYKIKATAWIAETPVTNAIIPDSTTNKLPKNIDVIGPSMDIGFRISKYASSRKFIISAELAKCLCEDKKQKLKICIDGEEELKGVLNGIAYPILWIDMDNGNHTAFENLTGTGPIHLQPSMLKSYLSTYINNKEHLKYAPHFSITQKNKTNYKSEYDNVLSNYGIEKPIKANQSNNNNNNIKKSIIDIIEDLKK